MAQARRTKQQKVTRAQRLAARSPKGSANSTLRKTSDASIERLEKVSTAAPTGFGSEVYTHVKSEIRLIGLIALGCFVLLGLATLLFSDVQVFADLRQTMGMPELL